MMDMPEIGSVQYTPDPPHNVWPDPAMTHNARVGPVPTTRSGRGGRGRGRGSPRPD